MPKYDLKSTNELTIRNFLDKIAGDKETQDSIEPTDSPIDYVAGAAGAKLGGAMARDAAGIIGNELGAVGSNIMAKTAQPIENLTPTAARFAALKEKLIPMLQEKKAIGQGAGKFADESVINNELMNITQRGAETGQMTGHDLGMATQAAGRSTSKAAESVAQTAMRDEEKRKLLEEITKGRMK